MKTFQDVPLFLKYRKHFNKIRKAFNSKLALNGRLKTYYLMYLPRVADITLRSNALANISDDCDILWSELYI